MINLDDNDLLLEDTIAKTEGPRCKIEVSLLGRIVASLVLGPVRLVQRRRRYTVCRVAHEVVLGRVGPK